MIYLPRYQRRKAIWRFIRHAAVRLLEAVLILAALAALFIIGGLFQ